VEHPQPDWTITKALSYLSDLYPHGRKSALEALRLAAREARVRITGCRCKWANLDAIDVGERENIRDLAWVDLAFEVRGRDWAAVQRRSSPHFGRMLPPAVAKLLVAKQEDRAPSWASEFTKSRAAEGWCHLRIYGADVLSAFPKPLTPDQAENLARFARLVAPPAPVVPGFAPNETEKPKPSKQKERRQVREAIEVLATAPDWSGLHGELRLRRVEAHLGKKCSPRTYGRAWADYQAVQATSEGFATSAT
jgi:hypothetical protein